ncbi:MAG: YicC/YloC family endoribonuclease [Sulfuricellaceae bacterium]|jgi:uncharacterized protein (TIGR00255 family)
MIYSMTGYAAAARELEYGTLNLELRSVNHRYLDIQFRMSEELRGLEAALREAIGKRISRGKVDFRMGFTPRPGASALHADEELVRQLAALSGKVKALLPEARDLSVAEVLQWPGVMAQDAVSQETLHEAALALATATLEEFNASRSREGEKLKALLWERGAKMGDLVKEAGPHIPAILAAHREKLAAALKEAGASLEEDRLRQELTLFAQRIDVDEEMSRLQTHLTEVRRVLDAGGAVGKRLDFLMQELNREANTLASKSVASEVTRIAVELKVLIEQMREQVQNIE